MNNSPLIGIVGGALAGATCAGILMLATTTDTDTQPSTQALTGEASDLVSISTEVRDLRSENEALRSRLDALEMQSVERPAERVSASADAVERDQEFEQKLQQLVATMSAPGADASPVILGAVSNALQTIREQEDRDRDRERDERNAERMEDRLVKLQSKLGLDKAQTDGMRTILTTESNNRTALFQKSRENGDFGSIRESMRELRTTTQDSLGLVLTPTQLEDYNKMDSGGGRGFGRMDRGGSSSSDDGGSGGGGNRRRN